MVTNNLAILSTVKGILGLRLLNQPANSKGTDKMRNAPEIRVGHGYFRSVLERKKSKKRPQTL